jgi:acetyl-CoA acetyltransferase
MTEVLVAGVGMTPFGKFPEQSISDLARAAALDALDDAQVIPGAIEAVFAAHARTSASGHENGVSELVLHDLGVVGAAAVDVGNFCASGSTAFREAMINIQAGVCDVALAVGVEQLSRRQDKGSPLVPDGDPWEVQFGFSPPAYFALVAQEYMRQTGAGPEVFARVAVKNRANAALNPLAQYREPISVEDVLRSPMVADPLTRLSCCPTGDGAAAAVLVSERFAAQLGRSRLIRIRGSSLVAGTYRSPVLTGFEIDRVAAERAYQSASIDPADVDVVELHDAFTVAEVIHYEDLLLCPRGEGGRFLMSGATEIDGSVAVSSSGGLLSKGHPLGATGIAQVWELVTQLRGEAGSRQVAGARIGLAHCVGGFIGGEPAVSSVHVLEGPSDRTAGSAR